MEETRPRLFITHFSSVLTVVIVAFLLVAELFFIPAQPQTFDEWSHLLTINGFARSISQGNIPVTWVDDVSNYGAPLGQISHQTTSYIGALFFFITSSTLWSYNLTLLLGSILGSLLLFYFLKQHFSVLASVLGSILFTFAPYRITNVYVRGALPEFFAAAFIPLILIGIHTLFIKRSFKGILPIFLGSVFLALSHPMMLVIGFSIVFFYTLYAIFEQKNWRLSLLHLSICAVLTILGVLIASYYLLPLALEIKYFHHGGIAISREQYYFLPLNSFLSEQWNYSNFESVGIRENRLQLGAIELITLLATTVIVFYKKYKKRSVPTIILFWLLAGCVYIFLMTSSSTLLYQHIFLLSGIQFPWRFLTTLSLIAPLCIAYLLDLSEHKKVFFLVCLGAIVVLRFPQLYAKNYTHFSESRYAFSIVNPHDTDMNSVWSEDSYKYPVASQRAEIIEGNGSIAINSETANKRSYIVYADTDVRMIEHTFYFPGWSLLIDDKPAEIVYQDPSYRGVITYRLPAGTHTVTLTYQDTRARSIGKMISIASLAISITSAALYLSASTKQKKWIQKQLRVTH